MSVSQAISTTHAPAAIGPYSQGVVAGPYVFVSGQLPIDPADGTISGETAAEQTDRVISNIEAVLAADGLTLGDVVKTTVYLTDIADFAAVNEAYARRFDGLVPPARAAIQVAALPKPGARVEIDAIALHTA
ncbi:MAG: Rid family detoxifying hydrolase [Propionibacteriaceae bacterium]|jgi:2-iminobutanoate/2-iminopropanoate deaminase|nr:Rid family detoxifying hydrolase [Propionibacteriaceae bacterium]